MTEPTRREFLAASAALTAGVAAGSSGGLRPPLAATADAVIFINMVGGPSHLDTFDPKPDAPSTVRGPFRPTRTAVPGLHVSELFPKLAKLADKFSLVRSLHHAGPPTHEVGLQLMNTGRAFTSGMEWPSVGAVVQSLLGEGWWVFPNSDIHTGSNGGNYFGRGGLNVADWFPVHMPDVDNANQSQPWDITCLAGSRLIRLGSRFVVLNQFSTVFDTPTWDCHADRGSLRTTLADYRDIVAQEFDTAFAALLTDLDERGLLDRTLVVAAGEFGRTPYLNPNGGRDHWARCWTALVAGGGVKGGRVIGASDSLGGEPADRPVSPAELVATIYHALGIPATTTIPGPTDSPVRIVEAEPVRELF